jgi:hypothetical protein
MVSKLVRVPFPINPQATVMKDSVLPLKQRVYNALNTESLYGSFLQPRPEKRCVIPINKQKFAISVELPSSSSV